MISPQCSGGVYRLDQMGEYFRQLTEAWESLRLEANEIIEVASKW